MIFPGFGKNQKTESGGGRIGNEAGSDYHKNGYNDLLQTHNLNIFLQVYQNVSIVHYRNIKFRFRGQFLAFKNACLEKTARTIFFKPHIKIPF